MERLDDKEEGVAREMRKKGCVHACVMHTWVVRKREGKTPVKNTGG